MLPSVVDVVEFVVSIFVLLLFMAMTLSSMCCRHWFILFLLLAT